jgi:hypothetical protein
MRGTSMGTRCLPRRIVLDCRLHRRTSAWSPTAAGCAGQRLEESQAEPVDRPGGVAEHDHGGAGLPGDGDEAAKSAGPTVMPQHPRPAARSVVRPSSCNVIPSGCEHGKADYSNTSRLSRYGCVVAAVSSGSGPLRTALAIPDGAATQGGSLNLMPSPLPQYPPAHAHVASGAGSPHGWSARPRAHTIPMTWTCRPCQPTGHGGRATP